MIHLRQNQLLIQLFLGINDKHDFKISICKYFFFLLFIHFRSIIPFACKMPFPLLSPSEAFFILFKSLLHFICKNKTGFFSPFFFLPSDPCSMQFTWLFCWIFREFFFVVESLRFFSSWNFKTEIEAAFIFNYSFCCRIREVPNITHFCVPWRNEYFSSNTT